MECVRQTIDSAKLSGVLELPQGFFGKRVELIIWPAEDIASEQHKPKRQLGFVDVPPLPDSFFDPLPEEELQAWGL